MELIIFFNENEGFFMALLTLVYVVFTLLIFISNNRSVKEMKKTREEANRPYIVVYTLSKPKGTVELVIENVGKTIAVNTKIQITPEFNFPKQMPLSKSNVLKRPILSFPPNYKMKYYIGKFSDFKNDDGTYPIYEVQIVYEDSGKQKYTDSYSIDFNVDSGTMYLIEKDTHDLTKEFTKFRREFSKLQKDIRYIKDKHRNN